ncbi:MAG: PrsW family intramembrane metalloprotease [Firmicutes bacterium]|nr:PrsW family intramembrane metalloprotease [Bacillota bacterium]
MGEDLSPWVLAAISILPGLLWLWFFYREDPFEPEPKKLLLSFFGLGMLAVVPAFLIELPWRPSLLAGLRAGDPVRLAAISFLLVGGVEEGVKTAVLFLATRRLAEYDEPLDGIIYGVTVGLGFAALENWLYAAARGLTVGILRAVVASLAHASFTGWLGYFVTLARFGGRRGAVFTGFILSVLLHGAYDFALLAGGGRSGLLALSLVAAAMLLLFKKMRDLTAISPFRPREGRGGGASN